MPPPDPGVPPPHVAGRRPTDLRRKAAAGAVWAFAETWGRQLLLLALFAVLARLLGPEAYGLVALATAVTTAADMLITNGGWAEALIQRRDLEPEHLDTVFWFGLAGSAALALAAAAGAGPLSRLFDEPRLEGLVRWLSLTLPLYGAVIVPGALLRREFDFAPHTARALLAPIAAGAVAVPMALQGFGVSSLVAYHLTQAAVTAAVLWRAQRWRPAFRFSPARFRELLPYVAGITGERVIGVADNLLPRLAIGYVLGPAPLGQYAAARRVVDFLFTLATVPLSRVALPSFASLGEDPDRLRRMLRLGGELAGLFAFPCFLGVAVVAPDLMPAVFGPAWAPSAPAVQLLALIGLVTPFNQLSIVLLQGVGRVGWQAALMAASTSLLALLLALVGSHGLTAVAAALLVRAYVVFPARLHVTRRVAGIDVAEAYRGVLPTLAAALAMAGAVLLWRHWLLPAGSGGWIALGSSAAVGVVAYAGALAVLARPLLRRTAGLALSLRRRGRPDRPAGAAPDT
jgi:O-antigen/teichoic acid export membrane protein